MIVSVTQEKLAKALSAIGRVAATRNQLAVLNNILLRTDGGRLLIAATNLEIAATQYIGAKIEQPGAITIPARLVTEFVSSLPGGTVELKVQDEHLHITSGKFSSVINGVVADEFPELPTVNERQALGLTLAVDEFKKAVSQVIIASSNDATRPILTGVLWRTIDGELCLAATDGYRLAEKRLMPMTSQLSAVVPASTLQEVLRSVDEQTEEIQVFFEEGQVCFRTADVVIVSQLVEGAFPDYRRLIPEKSDTAAVVNRAELSRIAKVSRLFAKDSGGGITIQADQASDTLSIHSIASEFGENTSEATAKVSASGQVTLNSRYLIEALQVTDGETVDFCFSGKLSPCIITQHGNHTDYMHVVMPMKS